MSAAVWYWREGSTQHGPVTWQKLQSMAAAGRISASDWVMREGWNDWKLACEANDSDIDMEEVGPPPAPPPLPLPAAPYVANQVGNMANIGALDSTGQGAQLAAQIATFAAPPAPDMAQQNQAAVPVEFVPVPSMGSAALPMPLPPLAPQQTVGDIGPMPADGMTDGEVGDLRRALRDGAGERREPAGPQWNVAAILALAASVTGLMFLAFEMGLVGVALGGWCLLMSAENGNNHGKGLALTAVAIGCVNIAFRVMCATMDLGLTHM